MARKGVRTELGGEPLWILVQAEECGHEDNIHICLLTYLLIYIQS